MSKQKLLSTIEQYLFLFNHRISEQGLQDEFASKAITILLICKNELNNANPSLEIFYNALGFHYWMNYFDPIEITNRNFASYLLMNQFIYKMRTLSDSESQINLLLFRFNNEALTPALTTLDRSSLLELKAIFDALKVYLELLINERLAKNKKKLFRFRYEFDHQGLSFDLLRRGLNSVIDVAEENTDLGQVTVFLVKFGLILQKDNIKAKDLIELKAQAQQTKHTLLQMPEVKEIQQFDWFLNLICNFINDYIWEVFESQHKKEINGFFKRWDRIQNRTEQVQSTLSSTAVSA